MKVGIICASDRELEPFLSYLENKITSTKALLKFYEGEIQGTSVVALYCGVCKVNAALATQILIDSYHVDAIINAGTAGGMDESINLFDTIISTEVAYHDVDDEILTEYHPWMKDSYFQADEKLLKAAQRAMLGKKAIYFGRMVTGEKFIEDDMRDEINLKYAPLSTDMETGAIAHVCYANEIPFIAIRSITDTAEHAGSGNFELNCEKASIIAKDVVLEVLKEYQ